MLFIDAKLSHISQHEVSLDNRKLRRWIVTKLQPGQYHQWCQLWAFREDISWTPTVWMDACLVFIIWILSMKTKEKCKNKVIHACYTEFISFFKIKITSKFGLKGKNLNLLATRMYTFSHWKSIWPVSWHFGVFKFAISGPTYFEMATALKKGSKHLKYILWNVL